MTNVNQSLGNASGKITLDLSDLLRAQAQTQQIGQQITRNLNIIDTGAKNAQKGVTSLSSDLRQMAGALGLGFGAVQIGRFALQADATSTAYKRQSVAALSLAGSQGKLNELLAAYNSATGNAIDKAQALADVTKLQATGFADSAAELSQFTTAARGISIAMGRDQDYVIAQLNLAIANQSTMRLDQIGLGVDEVKNKVKELQAADSSLSTQQVYQNAVLGIATQKYGALAKSTEAQATGAEKAAKAWKDFALAVGTALGPVTGDILTAAAEQVDRLGRLIAEAKKITDDARKTQVADFPNATGVGMGGAYGQRRGPTPQGQAELPNVFSRYIEPFFTAGGQLMRKIQEAESTRSMIQSNQRALQTELGAGGGRSSAEINADLAQQANLLKQVNAQLNQFWTELRGSSALRGDSGDISRSTSAFPKATIDPNLEKQQADQVDYYKSIQAIERSANADRLAATQQYESQRSETIRSYEQGIAREAQDFAISRQRAAAQLADTIADIGTNSARQAAKWATDLADSIADLQKDSGKRLADAQEATSKRLSEINEQYAKSRERAARDHSDNLLEAAANLDARAVFNEQKAYARSSADAADAHSDAIDKENEQLADRTQKEQESLSDRIANEQEANTKRLADAKEADALRVQDATEALAKQQVIEDQDRALRLARGAEDQAAQLAQMAAAQGERLAQIAAHAAEERAQLDEEFQAKLNEDGLRSNKWLLQQTELKRLALKNFDDWWKEINKKFIDAQVGPTAANKKQSFIDLDKIPGFAEGGAVNRTQIARVHAGEYVMPRAAVNAMGGFAGASNMARSGGAVSVGDISFSIYAAANHNPQDIAHAVRTEITSIFKELSN